MPTIEQMIEEIKNDPDPNHTRHNQIQDAAIELILSTVGTPQWENFISHFADNATPEQLARLRLQDDRAKEARYIRKAAAYLVANSTCGGATPTRLSEFVEGILDEGLTGNS